MNLKTYRARTMAECLAEVKKDLGKDAVILHTRAYKVGGMLGVGAYQEFEITAADQATARGPAIKEFSPPKPREQALAAAANGGKHGANGSGFTPATYSAIGATAVATSSAEEAIVELKVPAKAPAPSPATVRSAKPEHSRAQGITERVTAGTVDAGAGSDAEAAALRAELESIKRLLGQLLGESRRNVLTTESLLGHAGLAEPLANAYIRLQDAGVRPDLLDRLIGGVRDELSPEELRDDQIVASTLLRHLGAMMPSAPGLTKAGKRSTPAGLRPLVIALVGPTGVGKTTTIAKLAATYQLRHGASVGLVTCDTYRIAAVEQLRTYANIIGLPLKVALTPKEVEEACASLASCDVIILDTAGRSQHDAQRLDELSAFVDAARPDEVHMVLSAAAAEDVMLGAAQRFSVLRPTHLVITKLDEAVRFGSLVALAQAAGTKISFVTIGQEVPEHIEPARSERLARLVYEGKLRA
ncbi:MAG TPA: flagellar biosynthesis protein FlhF [Phycisphaerales bacterium]|nr:flagellar biosynthesis protein FlhF [Phycisphaerales bacterium]